MTKNIVLIGFMGSGKSTVGAHLAKYTQSYLIDSDTLIATKARQSIKEIFFSCGESHFRGLEADFIRWASVSLNNAIIATGGGMPIFHSVNTMGRVFYLRIGFEAIFTRLSPDEIVSRPLFSDRNKTYELYNTRVSIYEKSADVVINADAPLKEILNQILKYCV